MKHVVMYSGGAGSWAAASRVVDEHGPEGVTLLFADTGMEDADLYRFLHEGAAALGCEVTLIAEGRTPWEVFNDVRFLGNTRVDPCSRILKREPLRRWLDDECDPANTVVYLGIDWTEEHRFTRASDRWKPWDVRAPMCAEPYVLKDDILAELGRLGIEPPRLYSLGFPHNNCGGFCIKAGHAHFELLLRSMPERYAEHETAERAIREKLGNVAILRDRRGGKTRPLTLQEFRGRHQDGEKADPHDWGGCGCFSGPVDS